MASTQLRLTTAFLLAASLGLTGCGKKSAEQQMPAPQVEVMKAKAQTIPLTRDLVGRLSASRSADVRARVAGILLKRVYTEGTDVKQGQLLFQIDPAPLKAALNAQLANLAAAKATYANNRIAAQRARDIAAKGLLSKTDLDNAEAAERTSAAAVKQAQANVDSARINLGYANVTSPIDGRAGMQQVTEGALVGQGSATLLTTVEQIDPVYVNFSEAVGILDSLQRAQADGHVTLDSTNKAKVSVILPDGSVYPQSGTLDFSDAAVNPATGAVTLRGIVPNPDHRLLPGMYVNVQLTLGHINHAWLIPQDAVLRDAQGPYVFVVGSDTRVVQKHIQTDTEKGSDWIVTGGINDGDQIVVSGVQRVHPGAPATATLIKPASTASAKQPTAAKAR